MKSEINIEERKPIWIALSDFYVDNELQDSDFRYIASKIKESPYTLEQVKQIDREEVFPILYSNLLSVAGVWTGFQEKWLVTKISKKLERRSFVGGFFNKIKFLLFGYMNREYWHRLENEFLTSNS